MKLITGGAYQGKLLYAQNTYHQTDGWIDGRTCRMDEAVNCRGIHHFHEYVRRMLAAGGMHSCAPEADNAQPWRLAADSLSTLEQQAEAFAAWLAEKNPEILIVTNELGCGVVPMEKADRLWREAVGRVCTALAARSDEVVRVVCGIGVTLKCERGAG